MLVAGFREVLRHKAPVIALKAQGVDFFGGHCVKSSTVSAGFMMPAFLSLSTTCALASVFDRASKRPTLRLQESITPLAKHLLPNRLCLANGEILIAYFWLVFFAGHLFASKLNIHSTQRLA